MGRWVGRSVMADATKATARLSVTCSIPRAHIGVWEKHFPPTVFCYTQKIPLTTKMRIVRQNWFFFSLVLSWRDTAMASITERSQRMEKDLRETTEKHDRSAAELQVWKLIIAWEFVALLTWLILFCYFGCCTLNISASLRSRLRKGWRIRSVIALSFLDKKFLYNKLRYIVFLLRGI